MVHVIMDCRYCQCLRWLTIVLLAFLSRSLLAQTQTITPRNYIDISAGRMEGDFDTTVNSSLNAVTAVIGRYFDSQVGQLETSLSFSYLQLATSGQSEQSGMGDVIARVGATLHQGALTIYPALAVKLPTADENKQLGSGEVDVGGFLSLSIPCAAFVCGGGVEYIVLGDPPGTDYQNIVRVNLNLFRRFGRLGVGGFVQQESALVSGADSPQYLGANAFYVFTSRVAVYTQLQTGLNSTAADSVWRFGMVHWF